MQRRSHEPEASVIPTAGTMPITDETEAALRRDVSTGSSGQEGAGENLEKVSKKYIWLMVLAQFGVFVAFITPIAISLAIRIGQLAPTHQEYLGYITGIGAFAVIIVGPLGGILSDRVRSSLGRRRTVIIFALAIGIVSLFIMAGAPSIFLLGVGWVLAQVGWGQVLANLQFSTADRLPESQRGRVSGLTGFATQIAPVFGVAIAGGLSSSNLLLFIVPGAIGVVLTLLFVLFIHETDSRKLPRPVALTAQSIFSQIVFNPRKYKDFAWNWLGRFFFYFGLSLSTTFTAFFFANRLGVTVAAVAPVIAIVGVAGILCTTAGALGGGFLSDKLKRRRVFVTLSGILFAGGAVTMALSTNIPGLITGSLLTSVGIGMFAAVDYALILDVLPERETNAGRFMAIINFAVSLPQAVAPLIAPIFLAIGVAGAAKNYPLLYLLAAGCTLAGGFIVLRIRSVR